MKVLLDKVLVKKIVEERTAAGLIVPGSAQEYTNKYEVIAVGEGILFDNGNIVKPDIKVGDIIYAPKAAGYKVNDSEGNEYVVIRMDEVLAIVNRS
jgi:chaperonin GroES